MYKKILVPLDGSELAETALSYAKEIAEKMDSVVRLISVVESPQSKYSHVLQYYIQGMADAINTHNVKSRLKEIKEKKIKVGSTILFGHAADEIVDYADSENIDLIVMATHGYSGIKRWAIGSVADKVIRVAKQPVLLIRPKSRQAYNLKEFTIKEILMPLDGSNESEAVIPHIEEFACKIQAKVVTLTVLTLVYYIHAGGDAVVKIPFTEEEMEPLKEKSKDYLEKVNSRLEGKGIVAQSEIRVGQIAEEIIKLANEDNVGMIAMTTHSRSGVSRWALGSITTKVLDATSKPILLVKPH